MLTLDFGVSHRGSVQVSCGLREPEIITNVQEAYEILLEDAAKLGVTTTRILSLVQGPTRIPLGSEFEISFFRDKGDLYYRVADAITGSTTQSSREDLGDAFVAAMEWLQIL